MKSLLATGFIVLTIIYFGLLLRLFRPVMSTRAFRITIVALTGWALFLAAWSYSGVASKFDTFPLNMAPVLTVPMISILIFTFSSRTKQMLAQIPARSIVNLQSFRIFVELLLWGLFVENLLPIQMTFEGRNWDILSGLSAPLAAMFLSRSKWGLAIWNLLSLGLLINIVTIAILSMPVSFRAFANEPANTIVTIFPFILLPGMLVPLAYGLSFLSLRQIFSVSSPNEEVSTPRAGSRSV